MAMIRLPNDFREFLRSLKDQQVKYLVIGGYAVGYYGYPRATMDLDVWIEKSPENADRIVLALRSFGFEVPELSTELFLNDDNIVRMGIPPVRIEILTSISGVIFEECYQRKQTVIVDGAEIELISLQDLKRNKKASGRAKDLNDLENLPKKP